MTTPAPPQRWLAGWFHFPPPYERFDGRQADVHSWNESATWLHGEIRQGLPQWGASVVATMHRRHEPPYDLLGFDDLGAFAEQGLPMRRNQGVWASDGQRCFYIIRDDPAPTNNEALSEGTPPLHMGLPPIVPDFAAAPMLPVRHIAPALVPAG